MANKPDPFRTLDDPEPAAISDIRPKGPGVPRCRLRVNNAVAFYSPDPLPNLWFRAWTRILLGWRWERL